MGDLAMIGLFVFIGAFCVLLLDVFCGFGRADLKIGLTIGGVATAVFFLLLVLSYNKESFGKTIETKPQKLVNITEAVFADRIVALPFDAYYVVVDGNSCEFRYVQTDGTTIEDKMAVDEVQVRYTDDAPSVVYLIEMRYVRTFFGNETFSEDGAVVVGCILYVPEGSIFGEYERPLSTRNAEF